MTAPFSALAEDGSIREAQLGRRLLEVENLTTIGALEQAIRAADWYQPGEDYVIHDGNVAPGPARRDGWRAFDHGVRQSIEAREGVAITWTSVAHGRIMVRDYFRLYPTLAGLTATGTAAAAELGEIYGLKVAAIPPRLPVTRADHGDLLHRTARSRVQKAVELAGPKHAAGAAGHHRHAVRRGGRPDQRHARRGRDTACRGAAGDRARRRLGEPGPGERQSPCCAGPSAADMAFRSGETWACWPGSFSRPRRARRPRRIPGRLRLRCRRPRLRSAPRATRYRGGGLAVLGSQRNTARRHDDWVRGLAGQQGEPGESQFLVSLEDQLVVELSSSRAVRVLTRAMVDGKPAGIAEIVDGVQQDAETADRERRGMLREFEQVESDQREQLYARRQDIFSSGDPRKQALETIDEVVGWNAAAYEDPEDLHGALSQLYPVTLSAAELGGSQPGATGTDRLILTERIRNDARHAFETREKEVSQEAMGQVARRVTLTVTHHRGPATWPS